jgi:hypothetical protein
VRFPHGRGALFGYVLPALGILPGLRSPFLSVLSARFRAQLST